MQPLYSRIICIWFKTYTLCSCFYFCVDKISDAFLEGFKISKAAFIITNRYEEVAERLMDELDRGVTGLHAQGMYTEEKKCVLYCVCIKERDRACERDCK